MYFILVPLGLDLQTLLVTTCGMRQVALVATSEDREVLWVFEDMGVANGEENTGKCF